MLCVKKVPCVILLICQNYHLADKEMLLRLLVTFVGLTKIADEYAYIYMLYSASIIIRVKVLNYLSIVYKEKMYEMFLNIVRRI